MDTVTQQPFTFDKLPASHKDGAEKYSSKVSSADERQRLREILHDQTAIVPNLRHLFPGWSWAVHPDLEKVSAWTDEWLSTLDVVKETREKHRLKGNYVLSAAAYYPDATAEKLLVLTQFQYWIFFWDDEIDTGGSLAYNTAGTIEWCNQTKQCIDASLSQSSEPSVAPVAKDWPPIISMLHPILLAMKKEMADESCVRLQRDLHEFVNGVISQQSVRLVWTLPRAERNLQMRAADIGVKPCITQIEYAMNVTLSNELYPLKSIQRVLELSSTMTVLVNELVSFLKEAKDGQVENFVLLLVKEECCSLQEAVRRTVHILGQHYQEFNEIERSLLQSPYRNDPAVLQYIACGKAIVTGTTAWSYDCGRYFKPNQIDGQGNTAVHLEFPLFRNSS